MSHDGKMHRGEKWYSLRDIDGNLPEGLSPDALKDVEYYLEHKDKELALVSTVPTETKETKSKKEK